ncbi:DUF924 domain-containing protein [Dyella monticola]|uniref:DUF924 domain-containing protein n=1 Tax=Dyella monticola TaxID=1927958 RepID=A0A370WSE8_9GAMM|nr:DUF924 family protein [Dyella monticola]RDS79089.1 DUF924 domain-containing protein [Dyella monticola]
MARPSPDALAVLSFWFDPANAPHWFAINADFDATLRERFGQTLGLATEGKLHHWADTPQGWLALVVVLDQFSRNLHRNDRRAWAQDLHAQQLVVWGIEEGFDRQLPPMQRVFAYMPFEHAENISLQQRCVAAYEALCADVPSEERHRYTGFLDYARRHEAVIARFGRFPHRNAVLGRICTPEEQAYLAEPGSRF